MILARACSKSSEVPFGMISICAHNFNAQNDFPLCTVWAATQTGVGCAKPQHNLKQLHRFYVKKVKGEIRLRMNRAVQTERQSTWTAN